MLGTLLPAAWILALWATDGLGSRPLTEAIHRTGLWAVRFLLLALLVSPLRRLADTTRVLLVRRMLGVAAMAYALAHLGLYVADENFRLLHVASEIVRRFYLTIGFVALLGLALLGATSTDGWTKRLGRNWKRLQRLVYPIGVLALLHFFLQSKADVSEATFAAGLFLALMLWRLLPARWQGSGLALALLAPVATLATAGVEYAWYALATRIPAQRVLWANLDLEFGPRPAVWVGIVVLGVAAALGARRQVLAAAAQPPIHGT
nr:ferric reductase-like transmembrane domain-containing protein [Roseomonas acroporae]